MYILIAPTLTYTNKLDDLVQKSKHIWTLYLKTIFK